MAEQDEAPAALRQGVYIPIERLGRGVYAHNAEQIDGTGSVGEEEGGGQDQIGGDKRVFGIAG